MPFHEELVGLGQALFKRVGSAPSAIRLALELAVPVFRTAGYFQNKLFEKIYGRKPTAAERLLGGVTSGFPTYANPFFVAFLSGMAYENDEELAEGWLSTFGALLLSPVVETDVEQMLKGAMTGNFWEFMDALSEWSSQELGLETLAAIFRGIKEAARDWEQLTGVSIPTNWLGELLIWLNAVMQGAFDDPWPWPGDPPDLPPLPDIDDAPSPFGRGGLTVTPGVGFGPLVRAPTPTGQPLTVVPGTLGLLRRGPVATQDVNRFVTNFTFKGPTPSLWGILEDKVTPALKRKLPWILGTGGGWSKVFVVPPAPPTPPPRRPRSRFTPR